MIKIDRIMEMLSCKCSETVQAEGIALAENVHCLRAFILPRRYIGGKNLWNNCAVIISRRRDEELYPYLPDLLYWCIDCAWPGCRIIRSRLAAMKRDSLFYHYAEKAEKLAAEHPDAAFRRFVHSFLSDSSVSTGSDEESIPSESFEKKIFPAVSADVCDIDLSIDLLRCSNSPEMQSEGFLLAGGIRHFMAFSDVLYHSDEDDCRMNCAKVIACRSDAELGDYGGDLFFWLKDYDAPYAQFCLNRLKKFRCSLEFDMALEYAFKYAAENPKLQKALTELRDGRMPHTDFEKAKQILFRNYGAVRSLRGEEYEIYAQISVPKELEHAWVLEFRDRIVNDIPFMHYDPWFYIHDILEMQIYLSDDEVMEAFASENGRLLRESFYDGSGRKHLVMPGIRKRLIQLFPPQGNESLSPCLAYFP